MCYFVCVLPTNTKTVLYKKALIRTRESFKTKLVVSKMGQEMEKEKKAKKKK